MTREQERSIAVQDAAHKVASGEMTASNFWCYYVDESLFTSIQEFERLVDHCVRMYLN